MLNFVWLDIYSKVKPMTRSDSTVLLLDSDLTEGPR